MSHSEVESSSALTLVALAAGVGSRYRGLKQLEPVGPGGEALLEYSVYDALRAGFSHVVLVVQPETESVFRERFESGMDRRVSISYVHQTLDDVPDGFILPPDRCKPWGTGQAVLAAEAEIDGRFAVVNGDDFYGAASFSALANFLNDPEPRDMTTLAMVGFEAGPTLSDTGPVSRALCRLNGDGKLEEIIEILEMWRRNGGGFYLDAEGHEKEVGSGELVSMNIWGFVPEVFAELRDRFREFLATKGQRSDAEFLVPEVIQSLVSGGRMQVEVLPHTGQCYGITYPEDRQRVAKLIAAMTSRGEYPAGLWK